MNKLIWLIFIATLTACAPMTPYQQSIIDAEANAPLTCTKGDDCEIKWGRALQWILSNSAYKIRSQSDSLIATEGPLPDALDYGFVVSKVAQGNGLYLIEFDGGCGNIFGCRIPFGIVKLSFVRYVRGAR